MSRMPGVDRTKKDGKGRTRAFLTWVGRAWGRRVELGTWSCANDEFLEGRHGLFVPSRELRRAFRGPLAHQSQAVKNQATLRQPDDKPPDVHPTRGDQRLQNRNRFGRECQIVHSSLPTLAAHPSPRSAEKQFPRSTQKKGGTGQSPCRLMSEPEAMGAWRLGTRSGPADEFRESRHAFFALGLHGGHGFVVLGFPFSRGFPIRRRPT